MTEPMRDALSNLQEHLPSVDMDAVRNHLPNVDMDAVRSHLPSLKDVDTSAITDRVRAKAHSKRSITAAVVGAVALAVTALAYLRRRRAPATSPSMYTPPLPKP